MMSLRDAAFFGIGVALLVGIVQLSKQLKHIFEILQKMNYHLEKLRGLD
jgi:hypothetical protein